MKKLDKKLYLGVILIILTVILVTVIDKKSTKNVQNVDNNQDITSEEKQEIANQNIIKTLQEMEEKERMEYYFGIFLDAIEEGKYEKAYNLLYSEFKTSYFPTLEEFKNYIPKVFSEMTSVEYKNIERSGDLYILWISISDAINGKVEEKKEMNIVIQEKDYNDFVLSFSVI